MEDRIISGQESLELITRMIHSTRRRFERNAGMPFVIWGYSTLIVSIAVGLLLTQTQNTRWNLLWLAIIPLGLIGTMATGRKKEKHVSNYVDKVVAYIWTVIGSSAVLVSLAAMFGPLDQVLFVEALLINIGAALTGLAIRLRYVAVLGFIGILIAFCIPFLGRGADQIWFFAALVCTTMIIPGHIMNAQGRKLNPQTS